MASQSQSSTPSSASEGAPPSPSTASSKARLVSESTLTNSDDSHERVYVPGECKPPSATQNRSSTTSSGGDSKGSDDVSRSGAPPAQKSYNRSMSMGEITEYLGTLCEQLQGLHKMLQTEAGAPGTDHDDDAPDGAEEPLSQDDLKDLMSDYSTAKWHQRRQVFSRSQSLPWIHNTEDFITGVVERRNSLRQIFPTGAMGNSNSLSRPSSQATQRLSTNAFLNVQKFIQNPGLKGWSIISNLPPKITFCQPITCMLDNILYVCGRCVHKQGGPESAVLWEVTFSEYTALNWEESSLPTAPATDCLGVFLYDGCLHVVLIGGVDSVYDESSQQILSVWRRGTVRTKSPAQPLGESSDSLHSVHDSVPVFQRRSSASLIHTKKRTETVHFDWVKVAERKWNVYQFTTVPYDNLLIFAGGRSGAGRNANVLVLDLETKQWAEWPPLPEGICGAVGVVWKKQVLLLGGYTGRGLGKPQRKVYALDLDTTQSRMWYSTSFAPLEAGGCGAVAVHGEVLIVAGSRDAAHAPGEEVHVLSEDGRFWFPLASLKQKRCAPVLAFIGNRLLCFGGENGASLRTSIEAFDLSYFHLGDSGALS